MLRFQHEEAPSRHSLVAGMRKPCFRRGQAPPSSSSSPPSPRRLTTAGRRREKDPKAQALGSFSYDGLSQSIHQALSTSLRSDSVSPMTPLNELQFPVGELSAPKHTTPADRAAYIEVLRMLPQRLDAAVEGLTDPQLDTPYREGGWTVRQVVHHVADSHANSYMRFKLALTEDWPTIKAYDQDAWANLTD